MAGRGPAPKDPSQRARRNRPSAPQTTLPFVGGKQPSLPSRMPIGIPWPARTRSWWKMWAKSPMAAKFTDTDWSELLDTAVLHGLFWHGDVKVANELRLRVAKFGATPEDRARLKIEFADAEPKADPVTPGSQARQRYGSLRLVDESTVQAAG